MDNKKIIEKYLAGNLSDKELAHFRAQLKEDEDLLEQLTELVIIEHGRNQLKQTLEKISKKHSEKKTNNVRILLFKIAAGILVLLASGYFLTYFVFNRPQVCEISETQNFSNTLDGKKENIKIDLEHEKVIKNQDSKISESIKKENVQKSQEIFNDELIAENTIFDNYYKAYPLPVTRGIEKELKKAFINYTAQQYDSALYYFENALKNSKEEEQINEILFYAGNCLIENYNTSNDTTYINKAVKYFEALSLDKASKYYEQSKWYMVLLEIEKNNISNAINILDKIIENQFYNYIKAETLKEELIQKSVN